MPANVGEMFYTGEVPWHGEGRELPGPVTWEAALEAGGLQWRVSEVPLVTSENPPSPAPMRKAIVRVDRQPGEWGRVLGVCHQGFRPLQNKDGAVLFDAIFGQGRRVYHTGGYLGSGETIWLLAKLGVSLEVVPGDVVEPYALFTNSHNGSLAIHIKLTTVRVVCQNTLALALADKKLGVHFSRAHQGQFREVALEAQAYFARCLQQFEALRRSFQELSQRICNEEHFGKILDDLMPEPKPPRYPRNPKLVTAYERRREEVADARRALTLLRTSGRGMDIDGARGTFWGALNAVTEYVDHHSPVKGSPLVYALLGHGMSLKARAYKVICDLAAAA